MFRERKLVSRKLAKMLASFRKPRDATLSPLCQSTCKPQKCSLGVDVLAVTFENDARIRFIQIYAAARRRDQIYATSANAQKQDLRRR